MVLAQNDLFNIPQLYQEPLNLSSFSISAFQKSDILHKYFIRLK